MEKKILIAGLAVAALAAAGITYVVMTRNSDAAPTIRIGYLEITASLPLFIAEERGFLAEEGVNHESLPLATSNQLVDGIIADNLDAFVESSAVPVFAVELQSPGRLRIFSVSAITKQAPFDALLVREASPIKDLRDLAARKIGVFPGSTAMTLLKKYLEDKAVDVSRTAFVPIPPQNQLTALLEGSIDVLHAYEPTTAIALTRSGVRQLYGSVYADMLEPNPQGVAVVSSKFLKGHPDEASKVMKALERAMLFMKENEAKSRQILAKRLKLNEKVAQRSVFLYMVPHKDIDARVFQKYADMLSDLGEIRGHLKVEPLILTD